MNFRRIAFVLAMTLSFSALAKSYDLRQLNLASAIETWVKEAKANGTYGTVPALIKEIAVNMEKGNFIVADTQTLTDIIRYTSDYLITHYRNQI